MAGMFEIPGLNNVQGLNLNADGSVSPLTVDNSTKLTEMADAMKWAPNPFDPKSLTTPDFGALTNGSYSKSMSEAFSKFSSGLDSGFDTITNGMGATEIAGLLGGLGANEGGTNKFAVRLVSMTSGEFIVFKVMPTISESRATVYDDVMMPHHPGLIAKYNHTGPRMWSIGGIKLISRTIAEADENQKIINTLRGWLMPYYGYGTEESSKDKLGAPPDLLRFTAYGEHNIGAIPVVLENAGWDWPNDVDWIHTSAGEPFPVILNINQLQIKEAWSPREYSGFDLAAYKKGDLKKAYKPKVIPPLEKKPETTPAGNTTTDTSQSGKPNTSEPQQASAGEMVGPPAPGAVQPADPGNNGQTPFQSQLAADDKAFMDKAMNQSPWDQLFGPSDQELYDSTHTASNAMHAADTQSMINTHKDIYGSWKS